jgi:Holliday junction DNA helicase RuvA
MIYSLKGTVLGSGSNFAIIGVGGVGLKVFMAASLLSRLPKGQETLLFSHLHVREDALDLFGFASTEELEFFELLIGVSGVGPRSALAILDVAELKELCAAIESSRPDLLTRASGVGRKTAERIIIELKGKVSGGEADEVVRRMEGDTDLIETLISLGYRRDQAKAAVSKVPDEIQGLEPRLKEALKILGKRA